MVANARVVGATRVIVQALDGWDAQGLKAIATAATTGDSVMAALFTSSTPALVVVARSRNQSVDSNAVLKELVQQFGGRGGGKPDMAQGGGLEGPPERIIEAARTIIEGMLSRPN